MSADQDRPVMTPGVDSATTSEAQVRGSPSVAVPPGLELLLPLNQILVTQKIDILEVFTGWEQANKYQIFAPNGQLIYMMEEESDCCARQQCGNARGFNMYIRDPNGNGIILEKECHVCLGSLSVKASATGELLGTVSQNCTCCSPEFSVNDGTGTPIFLICGPCCTGLMCGDIAFDVFSVQDTKLPVGQIQKQWSGLAQEIFTDATNFGISFPIDLSVRLKAVLIGACILIDFAYFETDPNQNHHHHHHY